MRAIIGLVLFLSFCGTLIIFNGNNPITSQAKASTHAQVIIPTFRY